MPLFTPELEFSDDYPTIEPSLRLDFANSRALDPRITFTRDASGTYVNKDGLIKIALANEPRFDHDPITGESLGLLIEESRTNYQSGNTISFGIMDIDIIQGVSTASDVTTSPDGLQQAGRISGSGVDEIQRIGYNTQSTPSGQYNIFSVFVKADSGTPILGFYSNTFVANNVAFNVDLSDGTTNTINAPADFVGKVEPFRNGWYRVSVMGGTGTGASGSWNINLVPSLTSARGAQSGSNASASYLIWGVQEELSNTGPFPTSYIPTSGATASRAHERAQILGASLTSFLRQGEGSVICSGVVNALTTSSNYQSWWALDQNNASFRIWLYARGGANKNQFIGGDGSTSFAISSSSNTVVDQKYKLACAYKENDVAFYENGTQVGTDTSVSLPTVTHFGIGSRNDTQLALNGTISNLSYYPKRLTNTQLQTLTQ